MLHDTLIERATILLFRDAELMNEINKYFEIDALKDTWGKPLARFLGFVNIVVCVSCVMSL